MIDKKCVHRSKNTYNAMNCCRTCLSTDNLNAIDVLQQNNAMFSKELRIATGMKIKINDDLPQKICKNCINFIQKYLKFREKCIKAHNILLERINKSNIKDVDDTIQNNTNADIYDTKMTKEHKIIAENKCTFISDITYEYLTENYDSDSTLDDDNDDADDDNDDDDDVANDSTSRLEHNNEKNNDKEVFKIEIDSEDIDDDDDEDDIDTHISKDVSKNNNFNCSTDDIEVNDINLTAESISNTSNDNYDFSCITDGSKTDSKVKNISNDFKTFEMTIKDVLKTPIDIILEDKKRNKRIEVKYHHRPQVKYVKTKVKQVAKEKKKEDPVKCKYCHKMFKSLGNLKSHIVIHIGKNTVCEHCGRRFVNRKRLLIHCKAKHGYERTDKCSYCDWRGCTKYAVKVHERVHTGERPFVCSQCGATFITRSAHSQHIASHLPEKTVKCDQCPSMFKSVGLMNIHKNIHKNPRKSRAKTVQ